MNQSMITSAVTMGQMQRKLDTVGNNLANLNTTGYKRRDVSFSDLLFQQVNNQRDAHHEIGRTTPNGIRVGSGSAVGQTAVRMEQGALRTTERELDIALTEKGYLFELAPAEDGTRRFTRDGAFYFSPNPDVDGENFIVNQNGDYVLGSDGNPIAVPGHYESLRITDEGAILVTLDNGESVAVGELQLVQVTKPQLLTSLGDNMYVFPNLEELGLAFGDVLNEAAGAQVFSQGMLEQSNVDMGREMTEMMLTQRNYQFNSRAISIADEMMGLVNTIR
ncbi:flagellar hook-basal body protein [Evansella cellulosilytica]|uniref:flagellar hook-basal body protein n=1 Tax=Evansella cellulosilytica TaxID=1413 RepID=UPI0002E1FD2E|nr:flagellar hook-basal body protein [Evansella cellulosilytica]